MPGFVGNVGNIMAGGSGSSNITDLIRNVNQMHAGGGGQAPNLNQMWQNVKGR